MKGGHYRQRNSYFDFNYDIGFLSTLLSVDHNKSYLKPKPA